MKDSRQATYLSLSAASRLLGVHSTTLRRWADAGAIPVYITPGGHRRFARADIEALISHNTMPVHVLSNTWAQHAWAQARNELEGVDAPPAWLTSINDQERDTWRRISQQLMGVVLRYVSTQDNDQALLDQAHTIGIEYANYAQQAGMPLRVALEATLFFRDSLLTATMDLPQAASMRAENSSHLLRRISQVLNVVQLAVVAGYEER